MSYKKTYHLYFLICVISLFTACKKDYPAVSTSTPVFYFKGTIDGAPVNLEAGINNYYMYSSFDQDTDYVYNFLGELKQINPCSTCSTSIGFQINDYRALATNASTYIDSSLVPAYYAYQTAQGGAVTSYDVSFLSTVTSFTGSIISYQWNFGDGTSSSLANPLHSYTHPGYHKVSLRLNTTVATASITSEVRLDVPSSTCKATVFSDPTPIGTSIDYAALTMGASPINYFWDFGDGTTSTNQSGIHVYATDGIYKASLKITDNNGYTYTAYRNFATQFALGTAVDIDFNPQYISNPSSFSNIIVSWTDSITGIVYYSNYGSQPEDSYFKIISVENYKNNENNQLTKKLHIQFKCRVYDVGANNFKQIDNGEAEIAVAYK